MCIKRDFCIQENRKDNIMSKSTKDELLCKLRLAYQDTLRYDEQKNVCGATHKQLTDNTNARDKAASTNRAIGIATGIAGGLFIGTIFPYALYNDIIKAGAPLIFTLTPIITMAISGIAVGIIVTKSLKKRLCIYDKREIELQKEYDLSYQALRQLAEKNRQTHSFIPLKHLNTEHIQMLCDILYYGRADSWKETLNVLEQDLHNKHIENEIRHTARIQERTLEAANEAAYLAQQAIDDVRWHN